jgi:hypothetical protein
MNLAHVALIFGLTPPTVLPPEVKVPAYDQFVIVPLRVHVLTAPTLELVNCTFSDAEIGKVTGNLNAIWHKTGVHVGLESIVREPADQQERFRLTSRLRHDQLNGNHLRMLLPRSTRTSDGLDAYIFRDLPFNSAYSADDAILVREHPNLAQVPGGGDDPVARVMAHAVGHALGLPLHPDPENLMCGGTSGVALDPEQVDVTRQVARTIRGAGGVADPRMAATAAESKGDHDAALRLWSWLAQVPGTGAAGAKRRWESLKNP